MTGLIRRTHLLVSHLISDGPTASAPAPFGGGRDAWTRSGWHASMDAYGRVRDAWTHRRLVALQSDYRKDDQKMAEGVSEETGERWIGTDAEVPDLQRRVSILCSLVELMALGIERERLPAAERDELDGILAER